MPLATTNEVMIQVDWSVEAPRLPAMVGSETLAMVVSSTWVKVPKARAITVTHKAAPLRGAAGVSPCAPLIAPAPRGWNGRVSPACDGCACDAQRCEAES